MFAMHDAEFRRWDGELQELDNVKSVNMCRNYVCVQEDRKICPVCKIREQLILGDNVPEFRRPRVVSI